ncbi:hypothetical protein ACFXTI_022726 [Malus domestica]
MNSLAYTEELYNLAIGPLSAELYSGCHVNGIKLVVVDRYDKLCTQNSEVHVPGAGDIADIDFYGKLTSVVQLLYKDCYQVILLKCRWFDTNLGLEVLSETMVCYWSTLTDVGITTTPTFWQRLPKQIFYIDDPKGGRGWKVV